MGSIPGARSKQVGRATVRDVQIRPGTVEDAVLSWKVELLVRDSNPGAIRLYQRLGFVEEGRFRDRIRLPDGTFVDDVAMAWFPPGRSG